MLAVPRCAKPVGLGAFQLDPHGEVVCAGRTRGHDRLPPVDLGVPGDDLAELFGVDEHPPDLGRLGRVTFIAVLHQDRPDFLLEKIALLASGTP